METPCDSCVGACCRHMGTPPGFACFYPYRPEDAGACRELSWGDDAMYHDSAPAEAREILATYYADLNAGIIDDRTANDDQPCLWLDPETSRCRWHEHRPEICREFEPGGESCLDFRKVYRVGPIPVSESNPAKLEPRP